MNKISYHLALCTVTGLPTQKISFFANFYYNIHNIKDIRHFFPTAFGHLRQRMMHLFCQNNYREKPRVIQSFLNISQQMKEPDFSCPHLLFSNGLNSRHSPHTSAKQFNHKRTRSNVITNRIFQQLCDEDQLLTTQVEFLSPRVSRQAAMSH